MSQEVTRERARIRFTEGMSIVVSGTVETLLDQIENGDRKYLPVQCLSDGQRDVFVNIDRIILVENV